METVQLLWKTPSASRATSLWSEVGDGVDYYFVYGPELDNVIAGYRRLTGRASLMPRWAFGLWQSRQRYETAQQSLDAVDGFRARRIPFDNIVQDWFYWRENQWGSHEFDTARFPDPDGWVKAMHDRHARVMISVWGKFYPGFQLRRHAGAGLPVQPNLDEGLTDWVGPGTATPSTTPSMPRPRDCSGIRSTPRSSPRGRRLVDGRHRARRLPDTDPRDPAHAHAPDGARLRLADHG